uniref:G-protein coupled receptors family 1 profile domain-containing protein n=1 Tax=Parascaris equorum TaxID=6256 RepID=A0A914R7M3_PAREQ
MVCIAVYRLYALRCPVMVNTVGRQRIPRMLLAAWVLSALISLPQLFVWKQVTLKSVTQCLTIWTEKLVSGISSPDDELTMKLYNAFHLLAIFYIPLVILVVCYVLILHDIYETLNQNAETSSAIYLAETTRLSSVKSAPRHNSKHLGGSSLASVHTRTLRGQERLRRAKVKSLRITLFLILTYVVTWL